ncbi:MAG: HpaA family protein [Bacteroidota bacterium]
MSILGLAGFAFLLFGSIGAGSTKPLVSPVFNYSPPEAPGTGSANFTMALVSPSYKNLDEVGEPFNSFQKSLEAEIMEVMTAKGYSVRGPFESRDEMLYSDKENSQLALIIEVEPEIQKATGSWTKVKMADNRMGYRFSRGTLNIYGKINLTALEPISGEKMWAKSVNIPKQTTEEFTSSRVFVGSSLASDLQAIAALAAANDANVANPITKALEKSFEDIMTKIWNHLDPTEFKRMVPKIKELKAKG